MESVATPVEIEFKVNLVNYILEMKVVESNLILKLSKPLDLNFWVLSTNLDAEKKEFPILGGMDISFIQEYILNSVEMNNFNLKIEDDKMLFEFWFEIVMGKSSRKDLFKFILLNKKGDITEYISNLSGHVKKIGAYFQDFKDNIEIRFSDLKSELETNNKKHLDSILEKSETKIKDIEIDYRNFIERQKAVLEMKRLQLLQDYEMIHLALKNKVESNKHGENLYPILNDPNNENIKFSNNYRTIHKISGGEGWIGIRSNEIPISNNRYNFSIRLDQTDEIGLIKIGFCLNSDSGSSGFHLNCIAMLYLNNGTVYCPSSSNLTGNNFRAVTGSVITAVIDINVRMIYFLINGVMAVSPVSYVFNQNDVSKITPCVDIFKQDYKISIVNNYY